MGIHPSRQTVSSEPAQRQLIFRFPLMTQMALGMVVLYLLVTIWDQSGWWMSDEEYHFGFLVPLFVGFVLMERWPVLRGILVDGGDATVHIDGDLETAAPRWLKDGNRVAKLVGFGFGCLALGGLLVFLLGGVIRLAEGGLSVPSTLLFATSFGAIALSLPFIFVDKDVQGRCIPLHRRWVLVQMLLFPALIWMLAAPMPGFLKQDLKLFLLEKVVVVVFFVFEVFGYPLIKEGNTFVLPEGRVGVADACSGIRSLTGCVVTGSFLAAVCLKRLFPKIVLVLLAVVLAVVANLGRSLYLTIHAYRHGGDSIDGFIHDATGYGVLGVTAICLWGMVWVMTLGKRDWSKLFDDEEAPPPERRNGRSSGNG
jgi:exosortase